MTYNGHRRGGRPAFTLIELLVVIAIIAILMGLTGAAVMRMLIKGPELQDKSEISEMATKVDEARTTPNPVPYLPSKLRLREDNNYNLNDGNLPAMAERQATKAFLQQLFGRHASCDFQPITTPGFAATYGVPYLDWNGNGSMDAGDLILEGHQVLVFYLAGVPSYSNGVVAMTGFSQNNAAPTQLTGSRNPRHFEFQAARLKSFLSKDGATSVLTTAGAANSFPAYLDPWGKNQPYVYLASYKLEGTGDYHSDSSLANPYKDPTGKWYNASSYQILSAGRNGLFGAGGVLNPAGTTDVNGMDDQVNFSKNLLGAAVQ